MLFFIPKNYFRPKIPNEPFDLTVDESRYYAPNEVQAILRKRPIPNMWPYDWATPEKQVYFDLTRHQIYWRDPAVTRASWTVRHVMAWGTWSVIDTYKYSKKIKDFLYDPFKWWYYWVWISFCIFFFFFSFWFVFWITRGMLRLLFLNENLSRRILHFDFLKVIYGWIYMKIAPVIDNEIALSARYKWYLKNYNINVALKAKFSKFRYVNRTWQDVWSRRLKEDAVDKFHILDSYRLGMDQGFFQIIELYAVDFMIYSSILNYF